MTSRGSTPALRRAEDLAAAGHVEPQPFLDHHPLDRRARERLGREDHPAARPARGETVGVLARPGAQRVLGHDEHRASPVSAAIWSSRHPPTTRDAVVGELGAGREQVHERK